MSTNRFTVPQPIFINNRNHLLTIVFTCWSVLGFPLELCWKGCPHFESFNDNMRSQKGNLNHFIYETEIHKPSHHQIKTLFALFINFFHPAFKPLWDGHSNICFHHSISDSVKGTFITWFVLTKRRFLPRASKSRRGGWGRAPLADLSLSTFVSLFWSHSSHQSDHTRLIKSDHIGVWRCLMWTSSVQWPQMMTCKM